MVNPARPVYAWAISAVVTVSSSGYVASASPKAATDAGVAQAAAAAPQATDYSKRENWLSVPASADKPIDVFYLYPTAYRKERSDSPNISDVKDAGMVKGAQSAFGRQATAFEPVANIYAPYYRQADAAYTLTLPQSEQDKVVGGIPATDARAAFEYYLAHDNGGRPFILAGHSQGSNVLLYLLAGYLKEHPDVYRRMVVAYVIGYSVTPEYLARNPHLKFAEGPDDTGVIVSYNTEAPEIGGKNPVVLPGALAINPITWTRTEALATAQQSLGSISLNPADGTVITGPDGKPSVVKDFADARVDTAKGVVVCSTAPVATLAPGNPVFPRGVYHSFDYPFYYFNIRQNAAVRVKRYQGK